MIQLRVVVPGHLTGPVLDLLDDPAVSSVQLLRGASVRPVGDLVEAMVSREGCDPLVASLVELGVPREGSLEVLPVATWLSNAAVEAELRSPGASADAVVWPMVEQQAQEEAELNWTYATFMVLATLIAGVAIILDSPVLVIGAMVLGPEFGAVVAIALALVRRRRALLRRGITTLVLGFLIAMAATAAITWLGHRAGWVDAARLDGARPATSFIIHPDHWSLVVALIAGAAGVLALTSSRTGGLSGVFISVTTVPAAANLAMAVALSQWDEVGVSAVQLGVNITGMVLAGIATLWLQESVWRRVQHRFPDARQNSLRRR